MSNVWLCIPSARPVAEVAARMAKWKERGYKIVLWRDRQDESPDLADALYIENYPGYAEAANILIGFAMAHDRSADWFVTGGDDVDPDPTKTADEIAEECTRYFLDLHEKHCAGCTIDANLVATFGVMQPTGDRWGDRQGAYIDRVAGSPWIGREFARRTYNGNGPYWPEYTHMGVDEELQAVATKIGVFWQRPDLTQMHWHWGRPRDGERIGKQERMPDFLKVPNSQEHWNEYKRIFSERQQNGFPGHELLPYREEFLQ
jgi:hypothetical protein